MTEPTTSEATHPILVVTGGPLDGATFVILPQARPLLLGSATDCDIQILLGNVEPTHAQLDLGARGLQLSDGGSATGTYVNGEKLTSRQGLVDGDRICLGPPGSKSSAKLLVRIPRRGPPPGGYRRRRGRGRRRFGSARPDQARGIGACGRAGEAGRLRCLRPMAPPPPP